MYILYIILYIACSGHRPRAQVLQLKKPSLISSKYRRRYVRIVSITISYNCNFYRILGIFEWINQCTCELMYEKDDADTNQDTTVSHTYPPWRDGIKIRNEIL